MIDPYFLCYKCYNCYILIFKALASWFSPTNCLQAPTNCLQGKRFAYRNYMILYI